MTLSCPFDGSKESKERVISTEVRGAVASWLVSSTPDRAVRVRALACVVFLGKTLNSHSASLHPGV